MCTLFKHIIYAHMFAPYLPELSKITIRYYKMHKKGWLPGWVRGWSAQPEMVVASQSPARCALARQHAEVVAPRAREWSNFCGMAPLRMWHVARSAKIIKHVHGYWYPHNYYSMWSPGMTKIPISRKREPPEIVPATVNLRNCSIGRQLGSIC